MTKHDLLAVLKNHPKAAEAIFWWCQAWHAGVGSDLYAIMCDESLGYTPDPKDVVQQRDPLTGRIRTYPRWFVDHEIHQCFDTLDAAFGPLVQHDLQPVQLRDVREGQVLVAGMHHGCIMDKWPCRVYRKGSALGVTCMERVHGVALLPGSEGYFHALTEDANGYVVGFRR